MKKTLKLFVVAVLGLFVSVAMNAQLTTSTMSGKITDKQGAVPGAAIIATHVPTGSQYYAVSNNEGRYSIQGMRPGGPYTVSVQLLGYKTTVFTDVTLKLSEIYAQDVQLQDATEQLDEVVVVASASKFVNEKTGASTNVSNRQMMDLPNSSRSISAITKLSPYSNGMSFAGADGRSTNFTVDGANLNNNFGLSSNLPGGGTPISIDALEEIQLVVAPYDVRQSNFVGGGINAITKSGTNTFKGTAYAYYNNQDLRGNKVMGEDLGERKKESDLIYGATIGGPIVKDKLFFFVNFEMQKKPEQAIKYTPGTSEQATLKKISDKLQNDYGYNPGSYTDFPGGTDNMKILARLDWNIAKNHKLSARFNYTKNEYWYSPNGNSCDDNYRNKGFNRSSDISFPFANNMYSQMNNVMSFALELNSRFSDNVQNRFIATYTDINDQRGSRSDPFPHVDIMTGDTSTGNYIPFTSFGYELFTWNNGVKNKVANIQDNVTIELGNHNLTAGINWEYQNAVNSYMRNATGYYRFANVDDFLNGNLPLSFALTYGYDGNENPAGEVAYNQFALYVQDDWQISDRFKLTYGVRGDMIAYDNSKIFTNPNILAYDLGGRSVDTGKYPNTHIQVSPRIGFNWDIAGDKSIVLRGGTGFFQGRLPLVFFTNMPQYSGMIQGGASKGIYSTKLGSDGKPVYTAENTRVLSSLMQNGKIVTDVKEMQKILGLPSSPDAKSAGMGGNDYISGVDPNFKMPQIWKTSLAVDYKFPTSFPFTITAEGMFNKTIYGVTLNDWSINENKANKHFRGADNRINYAACNQEKLYYGSTHAYVMTNTTDGWGYTANVTMNMTPAKNLDLMLAYTRTESKEISGLPGSAANSTYTGVYSVDGPNFTTIQRSQYVVPDKLIGSVNYFIPFKAFHGRGLHLNLFYTGMSANGNCYVYSNDMNGDGIAADLIYIPANPNEIAFKTVADQAAFWQFVNQDPYLKSHKGQYAEAYAARAPWLHRFDARIAEDFCFKAGNTTHNFQLSVSIDNIGNLFNSNWGVTRLSTYQTSYTGASGILKYEGINENNRPVFSMNKVGDAYPTESYANYVKNSTQTWQILFGLKYFFN